MSRLLRLFKFPVALAIFCTLSALAQAPNPYGLPVGVGNAKKGRSRRARGGAEKQLEDGGCGGRYRRHPGVLRENG
jgi:hypothetical protein